MIQAIYNIVFNKLALWLTPEIIRFDLLNAYLKALITPINSAYQSFLQFRSAKNIQLSLTPQVCYIRKMLNDRYDNTLRRITLEDGVSKPPMYLYKQDELKPVFLFTEGENAPQYLFTDNEAGTLVDDFVIKVPVSLVFNEQEMQSLVKSNRLAGTKFSIKKI